MAAGLSRSPRILKGALVELTEPFLGPVPNVIAFQYNPETVSRELTPWSATWEAGGIWGEEDTAQPFDPGEKLTLVLELDATDALETPESHPVASISGVADRIAALEMLLYPAGQSLLGGVFGKLLPDRSVLRASVPVVLLVWGPGRIAPVRLISFSVDEQAFSPTLYPIRAKVTVALQVLRPEVFEKPGRELSASEKLAVKAYQFTRGQKEILARANLANSGESVVGILPF